MADTPQKTRFELGVELAKALAWPIFALFVLLVFWTPLRETAKALPSVVKQSESISIAGLSIKIRGGLRQQASPRVEKVLAQVSPEALRNLIAFRYPTCWKTEEIDGIRAANSELLRLGLLEESTDRSKCPDGLGPESSHVLGPSQLGLETQDFLLVLVGELARQAATVAAD